MHYCHYRIEIYQTATREWVPFALEPFGEKDAAESHRLELLAEYGTAWYRDHVRVVEFETEGDRRRRLLSAWRAIFPPQTNWFDRERESILLAMVPCDSLELAVGLASSAREPSDRELDAASV